MRRMIAVLGAALALSGGVAHADKLDDIIASGTLRCAVTLDIPPNGFRDESGQPVGFDVDYCADLAKALGVEVELVEAQLPERIPTVISGRADVAIATTSDTLERAKTIGFSIPYFAFQHVVLSREDAGVAGYEDLKGRSVGGVTGSYEALALEEDVKEWNDAKGSFHGYQTQADAVLAVSQGQIDGTPLIHTMAAEIIKSGKYPNLKIAGNTPFVIDYVNIITLRQEQGFLNYINLFINQQVRTGRYIELYKKWFGDAAPIDLTVPGVYR